MNELEYYKSLVTDEEVINALIKESKAREGEVEKSRVRPNLQFFQRTVSNLVSSNNRITVNQEKIIAKEKEKNKTHRARKVVVRKKLPIDYIKEILSNKIDFVKPKEDDQNKNMCEMQTSSVPHTSPQSSRYKRVITCKKTPFQQIREILTNNVDKDVSEKERCTLVTKKARKRRRTYTPERNNKTNNTKDLSGEKKRQKRKHSRSSEEKVLHYIPQKIEINSRRSSESSQSSVISVSDTSSKTISTTDSDDDKAGS